MTLTSLFSRPEPSVAIVLSEPTGWRAWSVEFGPRRLAVAAAVAPVLWFVYAGQAGQLGEGLTGGPTLWRALLGLIALIGALVVATYVPQRGGTAGGSSCARVAGANLLFAAWALDAGTATLGGPVIALGLVSFGLVQRLRGAVACA